MTRIYIGEHGNDKNDGLTKHTPIYSWKRARKLAGHLEIRADSASTRRRLWRNSAGHSAQPWAGCTADQRGRWWTAIAAMDR